MKTRSVAMIILSLTVFLIGLSFNVLTSQTQIATPFSHILVTEQGIIYYPLRHLGSLLVFFATVLLTVCVIDGYYSEATKIEHLG